MKLYIKQQVFSWADRFYIKDENGSDRFYAEGEIFSWGKKLHIYDLTGNEVAFIGQKLMSFMPRYSIEINGQVICEVNQKFTFFKNMQKIVTTLLLYSNIKLFIFYDSYYIRSIFTLKPQYVYWWCDYFSFLNLVCQHLVGQFL